jgi:hypothetical protein
MTPIYNVITNTPATMPCAIWGNRSLNEVLDTQAIADGWRYVRAAVRGERYKTSTWADDGVNYTETATDYTEQEWAAKMDAIAADMQAAADAATAANVAYMAEVQALRDAYAAATGQLCQLAGLPVVRVLTMADIQTAVMPLLSGESAGTVNGLLTLLTNLEGKLCRKNGPDALDFV